MEQLPRRGAGAVEDFDFVRFGGPTVPKESHVTIVAKQRVVGNNPDRVMLIITNNGPDTLYWSLDSTVTFPNVQQLGSAQQEVFQVQNDGALVSHEIWGNTSAALCEVNVVEVIRQRT